MLSVLLVGGPVHCFSLGACQQYCYNYVWTLWGQFHMELALSGTATSVNCVFTFWGAVCFLQQLFHFIFSPEKFKDSSVLITIIFPFKEITLTATLVNMKWDLVVLIYIFLGLIVFNIISCVCGPCWCLLWRNFSLFKSFILLYLGHWFPIELQCFLLHSGRRPLLGMWFINIFFKPFCESSFHLCGMSFDACRF